MKEKLIYILFLFIIISGGGCRKAELDVQNPNNPTPASASSEAGIMALSLGAVYQNGFNGITDSKYTGSFLGSTYFFLAPAYRDMMADVISSEAANNITNQAGVPDYVVFDNGTKLINSAPTKQVVLLNNSRTKAGTNMFFYEWTWMYFMNNACNGVLSIVDNTTFSGDAESKKNAIKAWAYFWKGYAYSHIGSLYYAGLIKNESLTISNDYVSSANIIAEANSNFDKAITALNAVTSVTDYSAIIKGVIASQNQTGKGGVLTPAMWIRNINTMKARNILVNKRLKDMTAADWNGILTLVNNGVTSTDLVFTARSAAVGGFMSASSGSEQAISVGVITAKIEIIFE